jgi:hypothetical protein
MVKKLNKTLKKKFKKALLIIVHNTGTNKPFNRFKKAMTKFNRCRETRCKKEHSKLTAVNSQIDEACPMSLEDMATMSQKELKTYVNCSNRQTKKLKREDAVQKFMTCGETACRKEYKASVAARNAML